MHPLHKMGLGILLLVAARICTCGEDTVTLTDSLYLGPAIQVDNVTAWPVYSKKLSEKITDYTTLTDAQEKKLAEVRETGAANGSARADAQPPANPASNDIAQNQPPQINQSVEVGGQVNKLVIENKGDVPILVLAGTLVKGGKQDRQIAQDFIIPPKSTVPVDAFCVEHGRWTANREGNDTQGQFKAQQNLAVKSVRSSAQYDQNQSAVWENVSKTNAVAGKAPQTATLMATIDETDKEALARRERIAKAISERLAALNKNEQQPLGLAYAVDGKVREVRAFDHPAILQRYAAQIVNTVAVEGDLAQREALAKKQDISSAAADSAKVVELINAVEKLKQEEVKTPAANVNVYQRSEKMKGAKAYVNREASPETAPVTQTWSAE